MTTIIINNNTKINFNDFGSAIDFLNRNEVKHDTWNKTFEIHTAPTMNDIIGYEDLVHEVERIHNVFNANVRMAY